jgi:ribosomal protein S20
MENRYAQKAIEKIQKELIKNNFEVSTIVTDLKKIREYSLEEQNPVVTKALRLAYEHLEKNQAFLIAIPDDEPLEDDAEVIKTESKQNDLESFEYFLSLLTDLTKKNNLLDLKEYNNAFIAF